MGKSSLYVNQLNPIHSYHMKGCCGVIGSYGRECCRTFDEFYPQVKKSNRKVIAIVSSISGAHASQDMLNGFYNVLNVPSPAFYPYRVSKAALNLCMLIYYLSLKIAT